MSQSDMVYEYEFGPYRVRTDDLLLRVHGVALPLAPKVVTTLLVLLESPGRVVSKDDLLRAVWGDAIVEEANLSQNIYTLRRQFLSASNDAFIETLPRRGYRYAGTVTKRPVCPSGDGTNVSASRRCFAAAIALSLAGLVLAARGYPSVPSQISAIPLTPAADQAYALGWYYWHDVTPESIRTSIREFAYVVDAAPSSALGYAGQAIGYARLADLEEGSPSGVTDAVLAEKFARRAVIVDRTSAMAHAARGFVEFDVDSDNRAAAIDLDQAVKADPDLASAHCWHGAVLLWMGDLRAARAELQRASGLDPTLPSLDYIMALDYYLSRDYKNAAAYAKLGVRTPWTSEGSRLLLAAAYDEGGQYQSAIDAVKQLSSGPTEAIAVSGTLAHVYASMGDKARARQALGVVERLSGRYQQRPVLTALAYVANDHPDEAFAWLSRLSEGDREVFALDPRFDPLRHDRRFQQWLHD